jgi:hypothetical protein
LSAVFGDREVDGGVGLEDAQLREAGVVLLFAGSGGAGAVGVEQGVAREAEEVVQLGERHLSGQVVGVVGVLAEPLVDLAQERWCRRRSRLRAAR